MNCDRNFGARLCGFFQGGCSSSSTQRIPRASKMINDNKAFPIVLADRKEEYSKKRVHRISEYWSPGVESLTLEISYKISSSCVRKMKSTFLIFTKSACWLHDQISTPSMCRGKPVHWDVATLRFGLLAMQQTGIPTIHLGLAFWNVLEISANGFSLWAALPTWLYRF